MGMIGNTPYLGTVTGDNILDKSITPTDIVNGGKEFGMRNRIINGDMRIDQRNAGASVTINTNLYSLDRWKSDNGTVPAFTIQQSSTAPAGFSKSLLATIVTGATVTSSAYDVLSQQIEGYNISDLGLGTASASPFTLSFWVRSSVTGTFGVTFRNSAANTSYCATYTISAANTWEYKTVAVPAITSGTWATDNTAGLGVFFDLGVGSTYSGTAGQLNTGSNYFGVFGTTKLAATTGATFYITGVQLEAGSVATPFDYRPYGTELALCQRYCYTLNSTLQDSNWGIGRWEADLVYIQIVYPVVMRTTPSVSLSGDLNGLKAVYPMVNWYPVTGIQNIHQNGVRSMDLTFATSAGGAVPGKTFTQLAAMSPSTAKLTLSAEL